MKKRKRIPADSPMLDLTSVIFGVEDAVARFLGEREGEKEVWIVTGRRGPKNDVRDTLRTLQEAGDVVAWRELWGRFQIRLSSVV